jgi:hypothetical protein
VEGNDPGLPTTSGVPEIELPHALACLVAQAVIQTTSGNLNLIEVTGDVGTWTFPNALPPYSIVGILVGGRPGTVYSTKFRATYRGQVIGEGAGPDAPFTTQIKRVNVLQAIQSIAPGPVITEPGTVSFSLLVNGTEIASTSLNVHQVTRPPDAPAQLSG